MSEKPLKVTLYIATSLDGFIADSNGGVAWLEQVEQGDEDYGYNDFYQSVDALIMGNKTYQQVKTFGDWPYPDKPCWIYSHHAEHTLSDKIFFTRLAPADLVARLLSLNLRHIWLVGGADIVQQFLQQQLVHESIISVIPIILGDGIPLFQSAPAQQLALLHSRAYPIGLVQLHYQHLNAHDIII